ncbi:hypothetical protein Tco_0542777 [Tanacetum coccineum]
MYNWGYELTLSSDNPNIADKALQLERENLLEVNPRTCLDALRTQFKEFFVSKRVNSLEHLNQCWQKDFKEYTFCEPDTYRRNLLENLDTLEAVIHRAVITYGRLQLQSQDAQINPVQAVDDSLIVSKSSWMKFSYNNALGKSVNETQLQQHESLVTESTTLEANLNTDVKALDAGSVITESSGTKSDKHDTSSSSGTYITHAVDADIRPVNDQVPFAEVQLIAQHNVLANKQQHTEQSEPIYDTYLLEKVDSNTTPDSTNMCHRGGEIDQDAEQYQAKSPLLKAEFLKTNDMVEKEVFNELSNRFLQLEKHCISLEISMQQKEESFESIQTCKKTDAPEILNKVNSRAKVQSPKIRNNNPVEPKNHTHKPGRRNGIGQRFSLNKSSAVHEKPHTPRSYLRWKPTGRIFKTVSLRWIPTGKVFIDSTTKVDSEPPNGSNDDITNPYECNQTLYVRQELLISKCQRSLLHDNIIPKPDLALELGKSISLTEAEEEAVAREVHATHARIVSGPDPEPVQEDQTGSNSGKLHVSLAGPNPEHMDDEFLATAYPKVHENLKLITDERVIEENPESHSVIKESDSTIPDPSHQTVTSNLPVIAPFTDVSSTKPSSLVTPPPINTEATTIITIEQEMSEVKKTDHSTDVLASIKSQVPTINREILWRSWPESIKNQESEKSSKGDYQNQRNKVRETRFNLLHQSTDKEDLKEFFNSNEDAKDKEVGIKGRSAKRRRPESATSGVNLGLLQKMITKAKETMGSPDASASITKPSLTSTGWQITDTRDDVVNSLMHMLPNNIQITDTNSFIVSKKRSSNSSKKLKGIQTLTPAEQEAADIMKALKESKKMSKRQPGTGGSNEGTGNILGVPDESTVISRASSEGTGSKPGVPDEEKLIL